MNDLKNFLKNKSYVKKINKIYNLVKKNIVKSDIQNNYILFESVYHDIKYIHEMKIDGIKEIDKKILLINDVVVSEIETINGIMQFKVLDYNKIDYIFNKNFD